MVTVSPDAPAPARGTVDRQRRSDGQAPHTGGECPLVVRLDDEVQVISLDGEVSNAETRPRGGRDCALDHRKKARAPQ